jgi:hypothetical protein
MGCQPFGNEYAYKYSCSGSTMFYTYYNNAECSGDDSGMFSQTMDVCGNYEWEDDDWSEDDFYWDDMWWNSTDDAWWNVTDASTKPMTRTRPRNPTHIHPNKNTKERMSNHKKHKAAAPVYKLYPGFGYCVNGDPDVVVSSFGDGMLSKF